MLRKSTFASVDAIAAALAELDISDSGVDAEVAS